MGLFLLILTIAGGTYYAMRSSEEGGGSGGPYADLSFKDLVELLLSQKDVAERWYTNPEYGTEAETRESLNYVYSEGKTEERVIAALVAYAEARNVRGDAKFDPEGKSLFTWKKSDRKPFTQKTVDILLELSVRYEVVAAKGEKDPSKLALWEKMMGDEIAAIDKAAASKASDTAGEEVATKADLDAALAIFEKTSVAESCLNLDGNFGFEARKIWDGMGEDPADVSLEFYATARDVDITGASLSKPSKCTGALDGPSSDALMRLADLFTNRAISTAADPVAMSKAIWDARKKVDAVAGTTSAVPSDSYTESVATGPLDYDTVPVDYAMPAMPMPMAYSSAYSSPSGVSEETGMSFAKPAYVDLAPGGVGTKTPTEWGGFGAGVPAPQYSMDPYTTDIGVREDHGPGGVWS